MVVSAEPQQQYFYGTGKRKSAIAKVRLYPDDGTAIIVNGKPMEEYFNWLPWQSKVKEPFVVSETVGRFRVMAQVSGGGVNAQAEAIRHGITRALVVFDSELKGNLRRAGFITRDSRVKESKKYGLKRARRAPQYTKR
ncbi:30S ribosomal protein S9 [Geodia barretti]|jgi:small subunit ribosomal protein S9|uniref:30S ribosomal protein S9 n=2 Tax=Geodia barretti TaxID=519541 RepID=A0AA35WDY8_GEOBA|nr:30S ribosomal protein S9 [Geodia barretti]